MDIGDKLSGPYRATKLWNEAITAFQKEMPLKRQRHNLRLYESAFTGTQAVDWLLDYLLNSPNFAPQISRVQTIMLLDKFLKAGVFVRLTNKGGSRAMKFSDSNNLYTIVSPKTSKVSPPSSPPAHQSPEIKNLDASPSLKKLPISKENFLNEVQSRSHMQKKEQLTIQDVWKSVILGRLQGVMDGVDIENFIKVKIVNGNFIATNASAFLGGCPPLADVLDSMASTGVLPVTLTKLMKMCIGYPPSMGTNLFYSENQQMLAFKEVSRYFISRKTGPFVPTHFYDSFINGFLYVEIADKMGAAAQESEIPNLDFPMSSVSTENLVLGMSSPVKKPKNTNPFVREPLSPQNNTNPFINFVPSDSPQFENIYEQQNATEPEYVSTSRIFTTVLPPNSCFETAFTSETPTTRIIPRVTTETLHLQESPSRFNIEGPVAPPNSPVYVSMDKFRKNRICQNQSVPVPTTPKHVTQMSLDRYKTAHSLCEEKITSHRYSRSFDGDRTSSLPALKSPRAPELPPRPLIRPRSLASVHHGRSDSGGYVNLALSDSEDTDQEIVHDELDVRFAVKSIYKLCEHSKDIHHSSPQAAVHPSFSSSLSTIEATSPFHQNKKLAGSRSSIAHQKSPALSMTSESPSIKTVDGIQLGIELMQILFLMVKPESYLMANMLLAFMEQLSNTSCEFTRDHSNKYLAIERFRFNFFSLVSDIGYNYKIFDADAAVVERIMLFLMKHREQIFSVPSEVHAEVQEYMMQFRALEKQQRMKEQRHPRPKSFRENYENIPATKTTNTLKSAKSKSVSDVRPLVRPLAFCQQVSTQQFENQKGRGSEMAICELLEMLINDVKMTKKDKQRRLAEFKTQYPHIYRKRFPTTADEEKVTMLKSKSGLLSRFKNLRL